MKRTHERRALWGSERMSTHERGEHARPKGAGDALEQLQLLAAGARRRLRVEQQAHGRSQQA